MTSLGDELCIYLQGAGLSLNFNGVGTVNLYSTLLPDTDNNALCAAVMERGGLPPVMVLTGGGFPESKFDQPTVQVRVRSDMQSYTAGNTLTEGIFGALQGKCELTLNPPSGAYFHLISAQQSPVYLGRDLRERHQWSQNFFVQWTNPQR